MPPSTIQHRRTHNLLLINKLLSQRDAVSPFTLVLDNLEQSARPFIADYMRRAKASNVNIVFVAFETLRRPKHVDIIVPAWKSSLQAWQKEITEALKGRQGQSKPTARIYEGPLSDEAGNLLVIDTLNPLCAAESTNLAAVLSSFISPTTSLLAVYHQDVPRSISASGKDAYSPALLTLLRYLATTVFTVASLHHVLARKAARERSHIEPYFGLDEGREGVIQGSGANDKVGIVLEMEHRRKSGRGVKESYFLRLTASRANSQSEVTLLEDHPLYRSPDQETNDESEADGTFELGLTDKQKRDREGVVLPYFDAQKGGGDGGRILYDMGSEDDFDEEEDEI
ncbi:hypothetical protein LTR27_008384 [Elasticomyces elasticus]|nr:hypothetical protein LTR27_008384 [Elasticomyces elasticus]